MLKIRIVTDSTCDLPQALVDQYQIKIVPLRVFFGNEGFRDGIDITSQEFYQRLSTAKELPTTSQPSPADFLEYYQPLAAEGCQVISLHISGKLSGTIRSAELAGQMVDGLDLAVVDSLTTSIGLGLLVLAAARAAQAGHSKEAILTMLDELIQRKSGICFYIDNLTYLYKGGRIGRASNFLGNLLNIKPLLTFHEGIVTPIAKIRGRNKALEQLLAHFQEQVAGRPLKFALVHSNAQEQAEQLFQRVAQLFDSTDAFLSELNPVVGTYGGPGVIGIAFCITEV